MKKLFITTLFFLISQIGFGQMTPVKLRSSHFSQKHTTQSGYWTDFTEWSKSDCLILAEENRVTIFSEVKQVYDVVSMVKDTDDGEKKVTQFKCLDENASMCHMTFVHITKDNQPESYLYLEFSNLVLVYKIYKLD